MMLSELHFPVFAALLLAAVYCDLRRHRIPNPLNLAGILAGLFLASVSARLPGLGLALAGLSIGLACFLPFYLLHGMGAGDVKLMAAVGTFLGAQGVLHAALISLIAGGLMAIGHVTWRALRAAAASVATGELAAAGASAYVAANLARRDRLPFAVPIAIGSFAACPYLFNTPGVHVWLPTPFL